MTEDVALSQAAPAVIVGRVVHHRRRPVEHRFAYPALCLRIPLSQLASLPARGVPLRAFGWLTFSPEDHGPRDGTSGIAWIRAMLREHGIEAGGETELIAFPRTLGWGFKPVSFWVCRAADGSVRAVLAEVRNTFGERHNYLLAHPDGRAIADGEPLFAAKRFHVSPFLEVEGAYRFRFRFGRRWRASIEYRVGGETVLATSIAGRSLPLDRSTLSRLRWRFPLHALAVVARIHWQALRLWLKRVPHFVKPTAHGEQVTR
jgi:DUF1365 family protein